MLMPDAGVTNPFASIDAAKNGAERCARLARAAFGAGFDENGGRSLAGLIARLVLGWAGGTGDCLMEHNCISLPGSQHP